MLNIAIAGLGTVGAGVVNLLHKNAGLIAVRSGKEIKIKAISARDKNRKRDCDLSGINWHDNPLDLAALPDVQVVVELIGGADGVAYELAQATLKAGKHLVTANKALLAKHGLALAKLAEANKVQIFFEAAVAGGIPVIKTLREGLAGNNILSVRGILNGTCNYILTRMREADLTFGEALQEAQSLGYAEADPSADVDGHDTAHKLALLAAIAFGCEPNTADMQIEGIRHITPYDLQFTEELGCRIKLLGVARMTQAGLVQHAGPVLVPKHSPLASVDGALNAVMIGGDFVGDLTLEGQGAGAKPTASAVLADIIDLASGKAMQPFGVATKDLKKIPLIDATSKARYYLRLQVMDKPGVVAAVAAILGEAGISMEAMIQRGKPTVYNVPVVITTHEAQKEAIQGAVSLIAKLPTTVEKPCLMEIED